MASISVYQPWFLVGSLYVALVILGSGRGQRRWTRQDCLWLWLSSWCIGLFSLYGLSYGSMVGALFEMLSLAAVIGAVATSVIMGVLLNSSYRVVVALLQPRKMALGLCIDSLARGVVITTGLSMGVLWAGGIGLAIAALIHLLALGFVDYCGYHRYPH